MKDGERRTRKAKEDEEDRCKRCKAKSRRQNAKGQSCKVNEKGAKAQGERLWKIDRVSIVKQKANGEGRRSKTKSER